MKIAILSRNRHLYSTKRLVEACLARGHEVRVIDILKCYMDITSASPAIWYMGEKLEGFDAVIPRIGASVTHYGLAVSRQFEMMGVYCLTESVSCVRCSCSRVKVSGYPKPALPTTCTTPKS